MLYLMYLIMSGLMMFGLIYLIYKIVRSFI